MPGSTYSTNLKVELMATGENSGTWGDVTNTNLGTALEQAIVGYGNPDYASDANLTISITNSNAAQAARALVLNVTSSLSLTATRELVVPTIQKQYIVQNNTTGSQSITVKTSAGTGITVPNGRKAHLYVDGTNVIQMFDFVDINGGAIDGTTIGAASASTGAFTTLNASGATTLDGNVTLGNASGDNVTVTGTITSHLLFTDNTYDIGANGATRPRNLFLAGAATIGGNLSVGGTLTLTGGVNLNGNVTVGDSSSDTLTINSTITSNLIFTDNTYDIGASGATRPRNLFLAGNATISGNQTLTGALTVDSTTDSSSTTTGSIQTDGGVGIAKALVVGTIGAFNSASLDTNFGVSSVNGFKSIGNSKGLRLLNTNTDGGGTVYANAGAAAGITIGADAGPLVLQSGGLTALTLSNTQTALFASSVTATSYGAATVASSSTGPNVLIGLTLTAGGATSGFYSPSIRFDVGGGGGGANLFTTRLGGAGGRFSINTDATNSTSYNRLLITEAGEWYWYNNNVTTGAEAMRLVGQALTVSGAITASGGKIESGITNGLVGNSDNATNNGIYWQVRPYAGKSGYLTFTENAVADRWAIGIQPADGNLYFRNGQTGASSVAILTSGGALSIAGATQYNNSNLTVPSTSTSAPGVALISINALNADNFRGAHGNIQFRSGSTFANNGAQATMFLAARNYGSAPSTANDVTEKVGLWIKGYYDNSGTPTPLYLGGYSYSGTDFVLQIDQNRNLGVLIDPAPWAWPNGTAGALQLQNGAALSGYNAGTYLSQNWYYNAGEKYIANGFATRYTQTSGAHIFASASNNTSGAGVGLTWVEKFSSDSAGVFRINASATATSGTATQLIVGNGNTASGAIAWINTADQNYAALTLSNWDGAATTYGPKIGFDNSGRGSWAIGSSDGRNNFEISRSWGTPDFTVGSSGQSFFGGSYSYGGAAAGVINLTGYGAPSIGFQAVANGALRAYLQHNVTGGGYGEMALYVGGDNNTNAAQIGWYVTSTGRFLVQRSSSRSELGSNVNAQIGSMGVISLTGGDYSPLDTGISINQGGGGCTMLLMWSVNTSAGTNTNSALYMLKFNYDGNNAPTATFIAGTNSVTFGVSGSNTLTVQGVGGNNSWTFISNQ